jgi:circadian clock protein KaiC
MNTMMRSGIGGFDEVLAGGFIRPSTVLIAGGAGSGKTTLALQSLFNAARNGERCLFVAGVSEPITSLNEHLSGFSFFDPDIEGMHFLDAGDLLLKGEGAMDLLKENIESIKPDRVIVDSFLEIAGKSFMYDFVSYMKQNDLLLFITDMFTRDAMDKHYIASLVDGIIYLSSDNGRRHISVLKMRGQNVSTKRHSFKFTDAGITVFPKIKLQAITAISDRRVSLGIEGIDHAMDGGVFEGDATLIAGCTGSGKTLLGMQFIHDGAVHGEKGLIITFEESVPEIMRNARHFGFDFESMGDMVRIFHASVVDLIPDEHTLLVEEELEGVKRVVVDSVSSYNSVLPDPIEFKDWLMTLISLFKSRGVTSLFTSEIRPLQGPFEITNHGVSFIVDNVILMKYVEIESEIRRAMHIVKMKGSKHDNGIKEFAIGPKGIVVETKFEGKAGIMSGICTDNAESRFVRLFREQSAIKVKS